MYCKHCHEYIKFAQVFHHCKIKGGIYVDDSNLVSLEVNLKLLRGENINDALRTNKFLKQ